MELYALESETDVVKALIRPMPQNGKEQLSTKIYFYSLCRESTLLWSTVTTESEMARTKPSGDDLAKAIASIRSHSTHDLSKKDLFGSLQKQNPTWKLTERRVFKYDKKLSKYQKQGSHVSVAESDNGDEESVGSTASNASIVARRLMMLGSSVRKSLSLRGGDNHHRDDPLEALSQTIDFVHEVDISAPKKGTNLLPQLEDDSKSFTDDDGCFKVHVNQASSATEETMSPKSGESLDDYSEDNSFVAEKELPIDNIEVANSGKVSGEGKKFNVPESQEPLKVKSQTLGKQQDVLLAKEENKRESLVCEGCVVL